jgi:hypothetical protein
MFDRYISLVSKQQYRMYWWKAVSQSTHKVEKKKGQVTIQINQQTGRNNFYNLLIDVYVQLNMF